jgi:CRP/FNR family transcriptional regulator, dissimilatory nitrate respiration regulator
MNISELLKQSLLFSDLSDAAVSALVAASTVRKIESGSYVFMEGDDGAEFYLLVKGSVKIFKSTSDGKEITIKMIKPGEIFAEVILFESRIYPATALAALGSEVIAIKKKNFLDMLQNEDFNHAFIATIMRKLRYLNDRIIYLTTMDVEERFFRYLAEQFGVKEIYHVGTPKKEMASAIGTIPETFSRMLKRLKKNGKIEWEDTELKVFPEAWKIYLD